MTLSTSAATSAAGPAAAPALSRQRRFILPHPGDTLETIAARELPDAEPAAAMEQLQSWNLHIFLMRQPAGLLTGCDVVFIEPPLNG